MTANLGKCVLQMTNSKWYFIVYMEFEIITININGNYFEVDSFLFLPPERIFRLNKSTGSPGVRCACLFFIHFIVCDLAGNQGITIREADIPALSLCRTHAHI